MWLGTWSKNLKKLSVPSQCLSSPAVRAETYLQCLCIHSGLGSESALNLCISHRQRGFHGGGWLGDTSPQEHRSLAWLTEHCALHSFVQCWMIVQGIRHLPCMHLILAWSPAPQSLPGVIIEYRVLSTANVSQPNQKGCVERETALVNFALLKPVKGPHPSICTERRYSGCQSLQS